MSNVYCNQKDCTNNERGKCKLEVIILDDVQDTKTGLMLNVMKCRFMVII
jgi:hypothetical protein